MCFDVVLEKEKKRRFALSLYLEGLGFHSIGRLLGVSHTSAYFGCAQHKSLSNRVAVINWIRKYGQQLETIRNPRPARIVEMDGC
jgi:transposase-like protein